MATKPRESVPVREKRGTSPSQSTHQHRKSPNTSKTSSPAKNQDSTASEKQIPNYLKPTISSGNDVSKPQGKKLAPNDGAHKPTLTRRRSFDKPPSPSRTQRTRVSPNPTLRSSSFSSKTTTAHKSIPDKYSKASKDAGKQSSLYARPVSTIKKSSTNIKKQDIESSDSTTKEQDTITPEEVDPSNIYDVPQPETKLKNQESPIAEAEEETIQVGGNNEVGAEVFVLEDPEPISMGQTEAESHKDAQPEIVESSTVSEQQDASLGVKTEEPEDKSQIEETSSNHRELETHSPNEINNSKTDEIIADNPNAEIEEKEGEHGEIASDKKEGAAVENEAQESKETEVKEVAGEEKQEAENVAAKKQGTNVKKDSAVSNDVIEETASKLREQRKNKVKALAGAFETVISLQEPK